jgi:hypothetical protein
MYERVKVARRWQKLGSLTATFASMSVFAIAGCGNASATVVATRQADTQVLLLPVLTGGSVGWCITVAVGGGCPVSRLKRGPIIAEYWTSAPGVRAIGAEDSGPPKRGAMNRADGFALTTSNVAAVAVDGSGSITTRREPGLPHGVRAVVLRVQGAWAPEVKVPSLFGRPPHEAPAGLPHLIPLDRTGARIPQQSEVGASAIQEIPGRSWKRPASAPRGPCQLRSAPLRDLVANAGFVSTRPKPVRGLIGRPFLSCASNSYSLEGWQLVASVLLDAGHPGSTPAPLPAMRPVSGHPGLVEAPVAEGQALARRIPGAWIVVARGKSLRQRLTVLEHLQAKLRV